MNQEQNCIRGLNIIADELSPSISEVSEILDMLKRLNDIDFITLVSLNEYKDNILYSVETLVEVIDSLIRGTEEEDGDFYEEL